MGLGCTPVKMAVQDKIYEVNALHRQQHGQPGLEAAACHSSPDRAAWTTVHASTTACRSG